MDVKDFVKNDNKVYFDSFRAGIFYYNVKKNASTEYYQFQVPLDDIGGATLDAEAKAIQYMRWIRKSIENKTFIKV